MSGSICMDECKEVPKKPILWSSICGQAPLDGANGTRLLGSCFSVVFVVCGGIPNAGDVALPPCQYRKGKMERRLGPLLECHRFRQAKAKRRMSLDDEDWIFEFDKNSPSVVDVVVGESNLFADCCWHDVIP